jgi:hypothetical protein
VGFKKLGMYLSILDFQNGRVIIHKIPDGLDIEEYVEDYITDNFSISNVEYMTTEKLNLELDIGKDE